MHVLPLVVSSILLLLVILLIRAVDFLLLLRRARWLLLSILLIYAYATPGEFVSHFPDALAPTYEGLQNGGIQALRLVVMLAALSLLLATSSRAQIMAGIYQLLKPFRLFGLQPERFAARLWLTLHYVEHMPSGTLRTLRQQHWDINVLHSLNSGPDRIALDFPRWHWLDFFVLLMLPIFWWATQ